MYDNGWRIYICVKLIVFPEPIPWLQQEGDKRLSIIDSPPSHDPRKKNHRKWGKRKKRVVWRGRWNYLTKTFRFARNRNVHEILFEQGISSTERGTADDTILGCEDHGRNHSTGAKKPRGNRVLTSDTRRTYIHRLVQRYGLPKCQRERRITISDSVCNSRSPLRIFNNSARELTASETKHASP